MLEKKIDFLDLLLIIFKNKKIIIIFTLIMSIVAVSYSLLTDETWSSTGIFVAQSNNSGLSASSFIEGLGLGIGSSSETTIAYKYSSILKSRAISEKVIDNFNLISYFNIIEKDSLKAKDKAVKALHTNILKVLIDDETNFINIKVTTREKELSKKIAEFYIDEIYNYSIQSKNTSGKQKRIFLEKRVNELNQNLANLSQKILRYQKENNIIDIENQAKASIDQYGILITEYFKFDLESKYLLDNYDKNNEKYISISQKKDIILKTIKQMEQGDKTTDYLLKLDNISEQNITITEMLFTTQLYEKVLEVIYPQYELARLEELDNMDKIEIIEMPRLAGLRTSPKRAVICILIFFSSIFFSSFFVIFRAMLEDTQKEKIKSLWKSLIS